MEMEMEMQRNTQKDLHNIYTENVAFAVDLHFHSIT